MPRYSDELELTDAVVVDVMRKAHEFDLRRAYNMCMRHCVRHVSASNAIGWLIHAHVSKLDELRGVVLEYVRQNARKVRDEAGDTMAELLPHPHLMLDVMAILM